MKMHDKFVRRYRQTNWMYDQHWLDYDNDRDFFCNKVTQGMYVAYKAGFNRASREKKDKYAKSN